MSTPGAISRTLPPVECADEDGVTIHVGGETFNVARCRLVQASPVLRDMISLGATPALASEPVIIDEVDAGAFRDFLWAMFVRPAELTHFLFGPKTEEKAIKLMHIAQLSHKFQDFDTIGWAMQQLHEKLPEVYLGGALLQQLFGLLSLFKGDSAEVLGIVSVLRDALRKQLACVEENKTAQAEVDPQFIDPIALIKESTESGFATLRAEAYYHLLLMPRAFWAAPNSGLSPSDKQCMLSGAFLLGEEWTRLRAQVSSNAYALPTLDSEVASKRPTDLLAKLQALQGFLSAAVRSHNDGALKLDVESRISMFSENLPEYFDDRLI
ncbi:hypothetical protein AURDEDRAFT_172826 [Auricularia subglabra TFB-10046 SS5]|nr:hypothetical protein AURDEDRAFT_172826 [Auricularia subglabra TFB-10046 SS5]